MVPDALTGGPHFNAFCRKYVIQTKGRWGGRPLLLEDWQREFWWEALELDPATGLRIYQEVGLGLPRKNGKSTQISAAGTYFLVADGENEPEVYAAAAAKNQAGIVMGQARSMVLRSPRLLDHVVARRYHIECPKNGGIFRAVSSLANLQHGFNPHANLVDELHAHKSPELFDALTTGTGARDQPITIWISTGGVADGGILPTIYQSMFDGTGELERRGPYLLIYRDRVNGVLIYWYGAPREADIEDPLVWKGCNPASWRTVEALGRDYGKLKARGALLAWRMYHLNQLVDQAEQWLPEGAWAGCALDLALDPDLPVGVGIDKTQTGDLAAIVIAQRQGERVVIRSRVFGAQAATGRVSTEAMRQYLRAIRLRYPKAQAIDDKTHRALPGPAFAYDKVAFSESAEMLEQDGLNMVDFPQHASVMAPATTQAYELITTRRLCQDGDAALAEHVGRSHAVLTDRGMKIVKVSKGEPARNPAAVAMVMGVAMAMLDAPKPRLRVPTRIATA